MFTKASSKLLLILILGSMLSSPAAMGISALGCVSEILLYRWPAEFHRGQVLEIHRSYRRLMGLREGAHIVILSAKALSEETVQISYAEITTVQNTGSIAVPPQDIPEDRVQALDFPIEKGKNPLRYRGKVSIQEPSTGSYRIIRFQPNKAG